MYTETKHDIYNAFNDMQNLRAPSRAWRFVSLLSTGYGVFEMMKSVDKSGHPHSIGCGRACKHCITNKENKKIWSWSRTYWLVHNIEEYGILLLKDHYEMTLFLDNLNVED